MKSQGMDRPPQDKGEQLWVQRKYRRLKEQLINGITDDMMTEIISKLIAVRKTNEAISKQVLAWARKVEVQKAQEALTEATKDNNDVASWKKSNRTLHYIELKVEKKQILSLNTAEAQTNPRGAQPRIAAVPDVGNSTTLD